MCAAEGSNSKSDIAQALSTPLTDLLALRFNLDLALITDPNQGKMWCVQMQVHHAAGVAVFLTMAPQVCRELARAMKTAALEASTKIIPAETRVTL